MGGEIDVGLHIRDLGGVILLMFVIFCGIFVTKKYLDFVHEGFVKVTWQKLDKDHSGVLEFDEFRKVLIHMGLIKPNESEEAQAAATKDALLAIFPPNGVPGIGEDYAPPTELTLESFLQFWHAQPWDVKAHL